MFKLFRVSMLAVLAIGLTTLSGSRADDKKETTEKDDSKLEIAQSIETVLMAHSLADHGRKTKSPEFLASAALLIAKTPHGEADETGKAKESAVDFKAMIAELMAEAAKMEPKNKVVAEIAEKIADLEKEKSREPRLKEVSGSHANLPLGSNLPIKAGKSRLDGEYTSRNATRFTRQVVVTSSQNSPLSFKAVDARTKQAFELSVQTLDSRKNIYTFQLPLNRPLNIEFTNRSNQDTVVYVYTPRQ